MYCFSSWLYIYAGHGPLFLWKGGSAHHDRSALLYVVGSPAGPCERSATAPGNTALCTHLDTSVASCVHKVHRRPAAAVRPKEPSHNIANLGHGKKKKQLALSTRTSSALPPVGQARHCALGKTMKPGDPCWQGLLPLRLAAACAYRRAAGHAPPAPQPGDRSSQPQAIPCPSTSSHANTEGALSPLSLLLHHPLAGPAQR